MNTRYVRNSIIIIGLLFIAAVVFAVFWNPYGDSQDIIDYLESTVVTAQAHTQWIEDYKTLTESYGELSQAEKVARLNEQLDRMEVIQASVEQSAAPGVLDRVKNKWNSECNLVLQAVYQIILGFENNRPEWISEAYEFLLEADELRHQWVDELDSLLAKHAIAAPNFVYKSYF
ncbi:hypothetical protein ACFLYS_02020 [Chloroflexota bacterium]